MKHGYGYKKLGRNTTHRRALLRNLATALIDKEQIHTTLPKAKSLRSVVEKLVTLGKKADLSAHRRVAQYLFDKDVARKLITEISPRYKARPGGYLRILKLGTRFGDGAEIARIEFVTEDASSKKTSNAKKVVKKKTEE